MYSGFDGGNEAMSRSSGLGGGAGGGEINSARGFDSDSGCERLGSVDCSNFGSDKEGWLREVAK
jgi:hypothetical protein